jgi:hypothetical protein
MVSFFVWVGFIHTGMNVHGGNPTIFGPIERASPFLGVLLVVGAFIAAPLAFRALAGRRRI